MDDDTKFAVAENLVREILDREREIMDDEDAIKTLRSRITLKRASNESLRFVLRSVNAI